MNEQQLRDLLRSLPDDAAHRSQRVDELIQHCELQPAGCANTRADLVALEEGRPELVPVITAALQRGHSPSRLVQAEPLARLQVCLTPRTQTCGIASHLTKKCVITRVPPVQACLQQREGTSSLQWLATQVLIKAIKPNPTQFCRTFEHVKFLHECGVRLFTGTSIYAALRMPSPAALKTLQYLTQHGCKPQRDILHLHHYREHNFELHEFAVVMHPAVTEYLLSIGCKWPQQLEFLPTDAPTDSTVLAILRNRGPAVGGSFAAARSSMLRRRSAVLSVLQRAHVPREIAEPLMQLVEIL